MDMSQRDGLIAHFQNASGIEDTDKVVEHLERVGWDIEAAMKAVLGDDPLMDGNGFSLGSEVIDLAQSSTRGQMQLEDLCSSKQDGTEVDLMHIEIQYLTKSLSYLLPLTITVGEMKQLVFTDTGVHPSSQSYSGFDIPPESDDVTMGASMPGGPPYDLTMTETTDGNERSVFKSGSWTVPEGDPRGSTSTGSGCRKRRISSTEVIDVEEWCPPAPLTAPLISVRKDILAPRPRTPPRAKSPHSIQTIDLVDSEDEYEDTPHAGNFVDEDIFIQEDNDEDVGATGSLIPESVDDEDLMAAYFVDGFKTRYGHICPAFYPGTLEQALSVACLRPAKDRKLLAIYIHHDSSVLTNVFCTELLCSESILETLSANFLIWGWDITIPRNRSLLLNALTTTLSTQVSNTIRDYCVDNFPALMIIARNRGNTELLETINGNIGVNELLSALIHAVDIFTDMQLVEMKEEEERAAREKIVNEQDRAYQESLQMDRAKEEAKRKQEQEKTEESQRLKKQKEEEDVKRQAEVEDVRKTLPAEPDESSTGQLYCLRFRCPDGSTRNRRFTGSDTLGILFDYLLVNHYPVRDHKVIAVCPRRDFSNLERTVTIAELGIHSQETLIVEER